MSVGPILTVGHSDRALADFLDLLAVMGAAGVADVRSYPASRRFPWFGAESLARELAATGIAYRTFGRALGGRRALRDSGAHPALEPRWRPYAEHMGTAAFRAGVAALLDWAATLPGPVALLCAERDPEHCHRRLIADWLVAVAGRPVIHWLDRETHYPHTSRPALRVTAEGLRYDRFTSDELPW